MQEMAVGKDVAVFQPGGTMACGRISPSTSMENGIRAGQRQSRQKRANGRYFTARNPFSHPAFKDWADRAGLPGRTVLEPFAGSNSIISHLQEIDLCRRFRSFDNRPAHRAVARRDTIKSFPRGFEVCVTNPPWLAKNSATARRLPFCGGSYDDVYKHALAICLDNCSHVAALVPESYIRSGLFRERLADFVSLTAGLFSDTSHPVGLAMFDPEETDDVNVWSGKRRIGRISRIEGHVENLAIDGERKVRFNDPGGNLGLVAVDNTRSASIRFCRPGEIAKYEIKHSSRYITRIRTGGRAEIDALNELLERIRKVSRDVLLTSYRGLRSDGMYRRRLDFALARRIIVNA